MYMSLECFVVNQNIIKKDDNEFTQVWPERGIH